jgi:hypothetical protein
MNDTDSRETQNSGAQKCVDTWIHAGDALEKIRYSDVKLADTAGALRRSPGVFCMFFEPVLPLRHPG